ncbi:transcriptional regulator [Pseudoprevotella muciniphila]|uniref:Transcriptional regulator n=1 Tax=Pseudoprevotella muciniphila TaxID=2133944 RepID=A0A5P8E3I0_9BACT|nr:transcriptional regulator [Pseudoprevotella muciniphila]QFQ11543.1 transcriptional regulator [Pseudoprevotella muciniphila]
MGENLRFVQILDDLRKGGAIADYVEAASILETNKAGISDIKSGRKKLSVEMLRRLKLSYPTVNIDWIIMGDGEPFISDKPVALQGDTSMFLDRIAEQAEEIGRLKARIEELERRRGDNAGHAQSSDIANVG